MEQLNAKQLKAVKGGETARHRYERYLRLLATGGAVEHWNREEMHSLTRFNSYNHHDPYWR